MHLFSLYFISRADRVGNPFSHGRLLSPQMSKGHFLWYFLSCPGRKKVRKEWRRTAVVAFADVNGVLQPYATATYCRCLCSFFPSGKKEPKKVLPFCAAQQFPAGFLQIPLRYRLKYGVAVRDARASPTISRSRRGRRAVYQIMGSKVIAVAYFSPYRISNPVGDGAIDVPK